MKLFQLFTVLAFSTLVAAACSSRGLPSLGGRQCPANWNPVPKTTTGNQQKVWGKGSDESAIPAGTYNYDHADLYYVDKSGFTIQISEGKDRAGVFKPSIYCVSSPGKVNLKALNGLIAQGASKLSLSTNTVETRQLGFEIVDGHLQEKSQAGPTTDSLSKAYDSKLSDFFLMKTSDVDYQVRSFGEDANGTYSLSMYFKKQ